MPEKMTFIENSNDKHINKKIKLVLVNTLLYSIRTGICQHTYRTICVREDNVTCYSALTITNKLFL